VGSRPAKTNVIRLVTIRLNRASAFGSVMS
jgi:hypothetical protein